jgi:hypothetical protein
MTPPTSADVVAYAMAASRAMTPPASADVVAYDSVQVVAYDSVH